jgi:hypothetical protein
MVPSGLSTSTVNGKLVVAYSTFGFGLAEGVTALEPLRCPDAPLRRCTVSRDALRCGCDEVAGTLGPAGDTVTGRRPVACVRAGEGGVPGAGVGVVAGAAESVAPVDPAASALRGRAAPSDCGANCSKNKTHTRRTAFERPIDHSVHAIDDSNVPRPPRLRAPRATVKQAYPEQGAVA